MLKSVFSAVVAHDGFIYSNVAYSNNKIIINSFLSVVLYFRISQQYTVYILAVVLLHFAIEHNVVVGIHLYFFIGNTTQFYPYNSNWMMSNSSITQTIYISANYTQLKRIVGQVPQNSSYGDSTIVIKEKPFKRIKVCFIHLKQYQLVHINNDNY